MILVQSKNAQAVAIHIYTYYTYFFFFSYLPESYFALYAEVYILKTYRISNRDEIHLHFIFIAQVIYSTWCNNILLIIIYKKLENLSLPSSNSNCVHSHDE